MQETFGPSVRIKPKGWNQDVLKAPSDSDKHQFPEAIALSRKASLNDAVNVFRYASQGHARPNTTAADESGLGLTFANIGFRNPLSPYMKQHVPKHIYQSYVKGKLIQVDDLGNGNTEMTFFESLMRARRQNGLKEQHTTCPKTSVQPIISITQPVLQTSAMSSERCGSKIKRIRTNLETPI